MYGWPHEGRAREEGGWKEEEEEEGKGGRTHEGPLLTVAQGLTKQTEI